MHKNGHFTSPTYGLCDVRTLRQRILAYLHADPQSSYCLVVGTDSQAKNGHATDFVTALVVHRVGKGGIYFWKRTVEEKQFVLKQRMYQEALMSLTTGEEVVDLLRKDGISKYDIEIHVDIGTVGETREMINEIVGMVRGSGFAVKTKPDAFGASKVADRYT